jgi:hypothetical protein
MGDWEVSTGELAALATSIGGEATVLAELARRLDQVTVGASDFGGSGEIAGRYAEAIRSGAAGAVRELVDGIDTVASGMSASAHAYDAAEAHVTSIIGRLGGGG